MIKEGKVKKNKGKNFNGKPQDGKGKRKKAPQNPPPKKKEKVAKDDTCFESGVVGHWKRNCPKYLAGLKNKKFEEGPSGISIFMIEMGLFTFSFNTWVFDTICGTHIFNSLQGFRKSRELKIDEMVLYVGNGAWVAVQAIGNFDLHSPFVSHLRKSGFDFQFVDDNIHSLLDGIFYFKARPINGIYELKLDDTSNNMPLYHVNTKIHKQDLNQTYLWNCHLGHINKKRLSQLQKSRLLGENDIE
uniref:GAG-pre-integrase domain-containing protein n=1 Tax=Lactuca sativa TaxID=4236 RepID=A0A9R1VTJ8_LACSA|nr:hypothetical protein LSAT_V11C400172590 [Lactuca sativa]